MISENGISTPFFKNYTPHVPEWNRFTDNSQIRLKIKKFT